jgi:hypothetical protein
VNDVDLMIVGADGKAYTADIGSSAPTDDLETVPSAFGLGDLGWIHEDGLTAGLSEDRTEFTAWGALGSIRTQVTKRQRTFKITCLESSPLVLALYDTVPLPVPDAAGLMSYSITDQPGQDLRAWIFDTFDGDKQIRYYVPSGEVTGRADVVHNATNRTAYEFTITAYPGSDKVSMHKWVLQPELAA